MDLIDRTKRALIGRAVRQLEARGHTSAMIADARLSTRWWLRARTKALRHGRGLVEGRAILWSAGSRCELVPVDVPLAGRGQVTIDVINSVVSSGTERAQYLRLPNARIEYPFVPGYSVAGTVRTVGRGVRGLEPGDLVAAIRAPHASVVTVPARDVFPVPDGASVRAAAMIRLGIICGQGVRLAAPAEGEPLCVLGAGLIGLLSQRMASATGAGPVTVAARSRRREEAARRGGAARFVALDEGEGLGEEPSFPLVLEATGDASILPLAAEAAARGGRIVLLGSPRGTTRDVPLGLLREKRLELLGAHVSTLSYEAKASGGDPERVEGERFLALVASGRIEVEDLLERSVDPREAALFYRELAGGGGPLAATFDWASLPGSERVRARRLWAPPDLSGRGADFEQARLPSPRRTGAAAGDDPFRGAEGLLRVGLLGCGDIAVRNAAAIAAAPNARLVACFDPVRELAEDLASAHGCVALDGEDDLLGREDVDAVFLSVPHHLHAPLAIRAAAAGKHVVVEKPPAQNLSAAVEMTAAARRAGVVLSICFPHRYQPAVVEARRLIAAGALGEFGGASVNFVSEKPPSYWSGGFSGRSQSDWRSSREKAGGGVLIMNLSHYLDLVRHLVGVEVESVSGDAARVDDSGEVEDTISTAVRYTNGALGTIFGCSAARGFPGRAQLHVWGKDGYAAVEPEERLYTLRPLDGVRPSRWQSIGGGRSFDIRAVYVSRLGTAIARAQPPDVTAEDGLAVQALMEAAYRAAETDRSVRPRDVLAEARA